MVFLGVGVAEKPFFVVAEAGVEVDLLAQGRDEGLEGGGLGG